MNTPRNHMNSRMAQQGQMLRSPTRDAAHVGCAAGADIDLHCHRPAGGDRDERCAGQLTAALEALKANG